MFELDKKDLTEQSENGPFSEPRQIVSPEYCARKETWSVWKSGEEKVEGFAA